jgi:hypothetical protein
MAFFLASLAACAGSSGPGTGSASGNRDVITLAEIRETEAVTAYQIIQELRPRWMNRNRGERTFFEDGADFAQVVVDGMPPREFNFLHELPREVILEIRFLSPRDATFKYGTGYNAGVLEVTTKR